MCIVSFFLLPYFPVIAFNSFFFFCTFLPFFQVLNSLPLSLTVETVHLLPRAAYFCIPGLYTPHIRAPHTPSGPLLSSGGGQPLGRTDRPCKSFGCCNKISSSWDLWGQTHVEEETPTVHEIVKNAKCIDRRKRCPNSLQFSFLPTWFCVFFNLSSRYHRYSNGQFRCFFGALEISVYIINRNVPAGDCNVIIKYSSGCWVYWILLNEICGVCVCMQCV